MKHIGYIDIYGFNVEISYSYTTKEYLFVAKNNKLTTLTSNTNYTIGLSRIKKLVAIGLHVIMTNKN